MNKINIILNISFKMRPPMKLDSFSLLEELANQVIVLKFRSRSIENICMEYGIRNTCSLIYLWIGLGI